jgi:pyruvate dehydrogenase E1 component alpha subunit
MADAQTTETEETVHEEEQVADEADGTSPDLEGFSRDRLLELLRAMLLFHRFAGKAEEAYAIGKIGGFCHLHIGQEAVAAGCIAPLRDDDYVITAYREHTQALAKGMGAREVMAELYGRKTGCSGGKGGSMHLFSVDQSFLGGHGIVGGHVPLAAGIGWKIRYREEDRICVCFLGDAAVNQGAFHEALNMAAVWNLPVLYIVENNEYGMGTAFSRVSNTDIVQRACAYDIPSRFVYGQDVLGVYDTVEEMAGAVRDGGGPHFLEVRTYRFKGHSTSDPVSGTYRTKDEVEGKADEEDPLKIFRNRLMEAGVLTQDDLEAMDEDVKEEVDDAADWADEQPFPDDGDLYSDVYS